MNPFKESVGLPGSVEHYLFKGLSPDTYLHRFESKEIYNLFRENIHGGPYIVFHRYHVANKTKLSNRKFKENAKICKKIIGVDANSLYLWALAQKVLDSPYGVRGAKNIFAPMFIYNDGIATAYLEYVSAKRGVFIQHAHPFHTRWLYTRV